MKQDGMYRYCIQFRAHTESEIRAGELLEKEYYDKWLKDHGHRKPTYDQYDYDDDNE